jgi:hypothetical protein
VRGGIVGLVDDAVVAADQVESFYSMNQNLRNSVNPALRVSTPKANLVHLIAPPISHKRFNGFCSRAC